MKSLNVIALIFIFAALVIFMPFAVIWALNTLFGFAIAYTFWTWLAVIILSAVISGPSTATKK